MSAVESPPPTPSPSPEPRTCPRCGAPLVPGQEWCLSCGADVGVRLAGTPRWRGPLAIAAVLLTLVVAGLVVAFIEFSDGGEPVAQTPTPAPQQPAPAPSVSPAPTPDPITGATPTPDPGGGTATPTPDPVTGATPSPSPTPDSNASPTPEPTVPPPTGEGGGASDVAEWPAGETAYTVIVRSARSRAAAERTARDLSSQGRQAGVLDSDDFRSLNGGYWVTFVGQYDTLAAAQREAERIGGEAYPRRVVPR